MHNKRRFALVPIIILVGMIFPNFVGAETILLNQAFSNYTPPLNKYFGTVEITDLGDNVQFRVYDLDNGYGGADSDLQWFYFNTTVEIQGLNLLSSDWSPTTFFYDFDSGDNFYKADGGGYFDGVLDFGDGGDKLNDVTFVLSADIALDVSHFMTTWLDGKDKGEYIVAAHIQSTDTNPGSEFVGGNLNPVPEPATMLLLGTGLIGLAGFSRKRFKRAA